jgi:hypothetical protein
VSAAATLWRETNSAIGSATAARVRGDREVIATLEDDLLALREQLVEEGSRRGVGSGSPKRHTTRALGVDHRLLDP